MNWNKEVIMQEIKTIEQNSIHGGNWFADNKNDVCTTLLVTSLLLGYSPLTVAAGIFGTGFYIGFCED